MAQVTPEGSAAAQPLSKLFLNQELVISAAKTTHPQKEASQSAFLEVILKNPEKQQAMLRFLLETLGTEREGVTTNHADVARKIFELPQLEPILQSHSEAVWEIYFQMLRKALVYTEAYGAIRNLLKIGHTFFHVIGSTRARRDQYQEYWRKIANYMLDPYQSGYVEQRYRATLASASLREYSEKRGRTSRLERAVEQAGTEVEHEKRKIEAIARKVGRSPSTVEKVRSRLFTQGKIKPFRRTYPK